MAKAAVLLRDCQSEIVRPRVWDRIARWPEIWGALCNYSTNHMQRQLLMRLDDN